ncbi:GNAT family N-acetyltransferase [Deinococcus peraridilitoris]|uniref:Putative acetyltransferase n=1 Tax=Deinococcus peraridilitoris (strain DSM 19664 / LMG 22246 / CIP 109416 / KR-200) TaxID=937777 RepID=L0A072_DEIPD|nr:GNAT family N-acetyltransferase [Deinococcus peraridilitoris]AFZ66415.1 putative acetyltransferase [Deinococcus peraridilitoris DSM 19664]
MIRYISALDDIGAGQLQGFFVGWPRPPAPETFLRLLQGSYRVILAVDGKRVVGFIQAISDGVLSAYIPLLEVLPEYQGRGVGSELVRRMLEELSDLYMVDVMCDPETQPFYARLGMQRAVGLIVRNYDRQSGT